MLAKKFDDLHWQNLKPLTFIRYQKQIMGGSANKELYLYAKGKNVYVLSKFGIIQYTKHRWNDFQIIKIQKYAYI